MKLCSDCNLEKPLLDFYKNKNSKGGYERRCKLCQCIYAKNYQLKNKDKIKERRAEYYIENKEEIKTKVSNYRKNNSEKVKKSSHLKYIKNKTRINEWSKEYMKQRRSLDSFFKLKGNLRHRLNMALRAKSWKKESSFKNYIGCDRDILLKHLESQFKENMNWENYGKWHIDHIVPLSSAKTEKELYKLCHYTNLQPLWAIDNILKANK